ncbi:hypothetical protein Asulf_01538 [Archaeoglobus sulfaticallidus PM70-1]|uniref:YokE-like PH domain-containing protein n=1 Tax=Archaeoglobus sulfaticallidus PM70-1 TaxID=387631 RepID=N0BLV2_9EURY|nr:PH domain-containing protein [Archaeoglobus sulfaticallidus]AGK61516.1 hypothetical protein Asulf_01538 [Archaeoglobus sulfaticallidus PM70-1]
MIDLPEQVSENLYPGEKIVYSVKKLKSLEKPMYLIVTDRRVIYFDQKLLGRYDLVDFPYEKLELVSYTKGKIGAEFSLVREDGKKVIIPWMEKDESQQAIIAIRDALNAVSVEQISIDKKKGLMKESWTLKKPKEVITRTLPMTQVIETKKEVKEDPIEKLKKLKELYDMGLLTEEEYETKRKELLEKL